MSDDDGLDRFVEAQRDTYDGALAELRAGRKSGHWMWFVFPQCAGLGTSRMSQYYAISSLREARDLLAHPVLGARLRECADVVASSHAQSVEAIFGPIDAVKLRSSMTLFHRADPAEPSFAEVLDTWFGGEPDPATDRLLADVLRPPRPPCRR